MAAFFASLNFPRIVILTSLLASAGIGWFVHEKRAELERLHREVAEAPKLVRRIQMAGLELDQLQRMANRENLLGTQADPETYIRRIAVEDNVQVGKVVITPSKGTPARGVVDRKYRIKPTDKDDRFLRGSIANFLYKLEADSRRVRVTHVKIDPVQKLKPGQIGNDYWTYEAQITSRQAEEE